MESAIYMKYGKVRQLGDPRAANLLTVFPVFVEEKLDGSQFRFGKFAGEMVFGSHHVDFTESNPPPKEFRVPCDYLRSVAERIPPNIMFFAEYLGSPRQNTITYSSTPNHGLMVFDGFNTVSKQWLMPTQLVLVAAELEIDGPRLLAAYNNPDEAPTKEGLDNLRKIDSYLGGSLVEGIVIKNYGLSGGDDFHPHFPMVAKYVRDSFKEENQTNWKEQQSFEGKIAARFKTTARWEKAIIHAKDAGQLEESMRDMRVLIDWLERDVDEEIKPAILEMLWDHYSRDVKKQLMSGFAEFYKKYLLDRAFQQKEDAGLEAHLHEEAKAGEGNPCCEQDIATPDGYVAPPPDPHGDA